jgi:thioredoxin-dependent peroxiredoxin
MQLQAGSQAPPLTGACDHRGNAASLDVAAGTHVLLVFFRYASCPICLLHVRALQHRYAELRQAGIEVIAVFHSAAGSIARHAGRLGLSFPVVADPTFALYARYGVGSSWLGLTASAFTPSFYAAFVRAMRWGFWGGAIDGDAARMPADFVISSDGTVRAAHYGRTIGDHLSLDEVLRIASAESSTFAGVA